MIKNAHTLRDEIFNRVREKANYKRIMEEIESTAALDLLHTKICFPVSPTEVDALRSKGYYVERIYIDKIRISWKYAQ